VLRLSIRKEERGNIWDGGVVVNAAAG
jgi:hypothetical protein